MSKKIKPVSQQRSADTRDRLIRALEILLQDREFTHISVADIAAQAGVSVGTVYRRFENKDAFLPVLLDRIRTQTQNMLERGAAAEIAQTDLGLLEDLKRLALASWQQLYQHRYLYRSLYLTARLKPELLAEEWRALEDASLMQITQFLRAHSAEIGDHDANDLAPRLGYFFGTFFLERALFPDILPDWAAALPGQDLADMAAKMAYHLIKG